MFLSAWGRNAEELSHYVKLGMTPLKAIETATANGPLTLGDIAPKSGQIKEGYDADLIAMSKNPLTDINYIAETQNITHVWKGGKCVKNIN